MHAKNWYLLRMVDSSIYLVNYHYSYKNDSPSFILTMISTNLLHPSNHHYHHPHPHPYLILLSNLY